MTTITRERLKQIYAECEERDPAIFEIRELVRIALASLEREQIRREHAEWSDASFGNVGPVGPLKHLSKEALEAAAAPSDSLEWADMQFLLWDAQRRAGITDEQITLAMVEKLAVNKKREWPEPKNGEPRLHIKEQPAPVVGGEYGDAYQGAREDLAIWKRRALEAESRARQLPQSYQHLSELYHAQEKRLFKIAQRIKGPAFEKYAHSLSQAIDVLESAIFGEHEEPGNSAMLSPLSQQEQR